MIPRFPDLPGPIRLAIRPGTHAAVTATIVVGGAVLAVTGGPTPLSGQIALVGADVIDGTGGPVVSDAVVVVEGDRIACVGTETRCPVPDGAERVDLSGRVITPGLIDAHVHFAQTGWHDGRPDGISAPDVYPYPETVADLRADPDRWHRSYLCSGITAVFDVGGAPWTVTDPHATDIDRSDRAHVRAAGPLITHASDRNRFFVSDGGAQPMFLPMDSDEEVREGVARLVEMGSAAVKVWFLQAPEGRWEELDARLMLVGELARAAGLPLIVHATDLRGAKQALRAGAALLVHSVQDRPVDREFLDLLLRNDAVYAPTLRVGRGWSRAVASVHFEAPLAVDDPNRCVDVELLDRIRHPERLSDGVTTAEQNVAMMSRLERVGEAQRRMAENLIAVRDAGGRIVVATDAGNPMTLHGPSIYAEMEAMQAAGMSPDEIIVAATSEGAVLLALDDVTGTLEEGKIADLIVLTADPREDVRNFRSLSHVMRAGALRSQEELQVR